MPPEKIYKEMLDWPDDDPPTVLYHPNPKSGLPNGVIPAGFECFDLTTISYRGRDYNVFGISRDFTLENGALEEGVVKRFYRDRAVLRIKTDTKAPAGWAIESFYVAQRVPCSAAVLGRPSNKLV